MGNCVITRGWRALHAVSSYQPSSTSTTLTSDYALAIYFCINNEGGKLTINDVDCITITSTRSYKMGVGLARKGDVIATDNVNYCRIIVLN